MRFANPWVLIVCVFIPLVIYLSGRFEYKLNSSFRFSNQGFLGNIKPSLRVFLGRKIVYLRALGLLLLVMALARPQAPVEETKVFVEGVDIVLALDTSGSMQAMDFEMGGKRFDRLTVVKGVVEEFIKNRPNDRIGLVAFSSQAYTVCPLTLDHEWLDKNLERVQLGMIEDGTAIGAAISGAVNRLKGTESKEKVVILLTDGVNNAGKISPMAAAEAAKALNIRIYTIGVGTKGLAPFPVQDRFGNIVLQPVEIDMDEELLEKIAQITGGEYFKATDTQSLWDIYKEIDKLEKTEIEEVGYLRFNELFGMFLFPALFILMLEIILSNTVLRRLP